MADRVWCLQSPKLYSKLTNQESMLRHTLPGGICLKEEGAVLCWSGAPAPSIVSCPQGCVFLEGRTSEHHLLVTDRYFIFQDFFPIFYLYLHSPLTVQHCLRSDKTSISEYRYVTCSDERWEKHQSHWPHFQIISWYFGRFPKMQ